MMNTTSSLGTIQSVLRISTRCKPRHDLKQLNCIHIQHGASARATKAQFFNIRPVASRCFSSSTNKQAKNRIYDPVRRPDELSSYILASTSSYTPLLTLWTASWCPSCRIVSPLLRSLISSGIGESEGGVAYCEVEFDSQDIMDSGLGMQYMITSMPTLLTFDRGEAMQDSRTMDVGRLRDREWLREWIEKEARRRGGGNSGGGIGGGLFGGLFGNRR